jgi:hypothetical protein
MGSERRIKVEREGTKGRSLRRHDSDLLSKLEMYRVHSRETPVKSHSGQPQIEGAGGGREEVLRGVVRGIGIETEEFRRF